MLLDCEFCPKINGNWFIEFYEVISGDFTSDETFEMFSIFGFTIFGNAPAMSYEGDRLKGEFERSSPGVIFDFLPPLLFKF